MSASKPPPPTSAAVLSRLPEVRTWQEDFYRNLHAHPELSHHEVATAGAVAQSLRADGFEVHEGIGGTGVVGLLRNGDGPTVLARADMDALPVQELTELPYASEVVVKGASGDEVPVMHACGHDVHVTCLLGAARLLSAARDQWAGTLVALFQPAEETGDGARSMVDGGLTTVVPRIDVAMAQHVLALPAGDVATRVGPVLAAADSLRITVFGRGSHGSMPHASVDPVVLAAMIVVRLQTVVSRETRPGEPVVVTVGSLRAGTKSNVIADRAVIELNVRTFSEASRAATLAAITRIVNAECDASGSPRPATFELFDQFGLTDNDEAVTSRVAAAFDAHFGPRAHAIEAQSASEDFSDLAHAYDAPYTYWGIGGTDPDLFDRALRAGRVASDVPVNHSGYFAPVIQPTLDTGTEALVVAALAWLAQPSV